ncbi:MAG: esterase [Bacteroidota bacterium]
MIHHKKSVHYKTSNTYETLNGITPTTTNIWIVVHGMGFLSRFFLKPFQQLNAEENYFIAPQAPSKYYLKNDFKYVGASWLTKENTQSEIENIMNYLDAVLENEPFPKNKNLIYFGFSQGVSIITRFLCRKRTNPSSLILYAGSIPNELTAEDFNHLDFEHTKVKMVYGDKDQFLTPQRLEAELQKSEKLFKGHAEFVHFPGGHEILPNILNDLL